MRVSRMLLSMSMAPKTGGTSGQREGPERGPRWKLARERRRVEEKATHQSIMVSSENS